MKHTPALLLALIFLTSTNVAAQTDQHDLTARRVLSTTPLVDGHNDLPWAIRRMAGGRVADYDLRSRTPGHTDLERLQKGMVGAQFWSVYVPGEYADSGYARVQLEEFDIARRVIEMYPDRFKLALTASDVWDAFGEGKIGSILGMEGGHVIENSLGALRAYYDLGARYMTLTHGVTIDWADSATDEARHGGLTPFGEEVVREMNRIGMLVDLSHTSPATMSDALNVTQAPVIFSHSSARALTDVPRNVPDSILHRVRENGGIVMVTFVPRFISQEIADYYETLEQQRKALQERYPDDPAQVEAALESWTNANPVPQATLSQAADHIEHIRRVAGVDHVGIGGDFDGIDTVPVGLEDVSTYPALFAELSRRGWSEADLRKLAGENILRVMREAEIVAARLQRQDGPQFQMTPPRLMPQL